MTKLELQDRLSHIKEQEDKLGVKINIHQLIDESHLDCVWYGGEIGTIECQDGYIITIGAYGDIRLCGMIDGQIIDIKDKNNSGRVYEEIGGLVDDDEFHNLITGYGQNNDWLCFENNNWFEVDLISPQGEWIDLCGADNVLSDNLLECFEDIETYFDYIQWAKEEYYG